MGWTHAAPRRRTWSLLGALAVGIVLVGESSGVALAHRDKLPPDALSLVTQAAALLAQDPKMSGEAKERLEAALKSKDLRGVDPVKVKQAFDALTARDIRGARRALAEATAMPEAGSPVLPPRPQVSDAMAQMKMAEPLAAQYGGTRGEVAAALAGLALVVVGFVTLIRRG